MISKSEFLSRVQKEIFENPNWQENRKKIRQIRKIMRITDFVCCISFIIFFLIIEQFLLLPEIEAIFLVVALLFICFFLFIYYVSLDKEPFKNISKKAESFLGFHCIDEDEKISLKQKELERIKLKLCGVPQSYEIMDFVTSNEIKDFEFIRLRRITKRTVATPRYCFILKIPQSHFYPHWIFLIEKKWWKTVFRAKKIFVKNKKFKFYVPSDCPTPHFLPNISNDDISLIYQLKPRKITCSFFKITCSFFKITCSFFENNLYLSFVSDSKMLKLQDNQLDNIKEYERFYDQIKLIVQFAKKMSS